MSNTRPIELVMPYPKGGGSDQRAQLIARHLARQLGEPVEVVYRAGAIHGHAAIAQAAPDGRTIGQISGEIGMMHWHSGLTDLTPADYTPLAVPFVEAAAVIVRHDAPWQTLQDLLDAYRDNGLHGSGGPHFSVWKFALAGLLDAAGLDPSRLAWTETASGEQGVENTIAGVANVAPITLTDARHFLRSAQVRALANMDLQRHPVFADVPTVKESIGLDWSVAHWRGIVAPKGLPEAQRRRYIDALQRIADDPAFQQEAQASAFNVQWRFGDDFAHYMDEDDARFGHVIRLLNARSAGQH